MVAVTGDVTRLLERGAGDREASAELIAQKAYALLSSMSGRVTSEKATKTLATVCRHSAAVLAFARRNDDARRMSEEKRGSSRRSCGAKSVRCLSH